MKPLTLGLSMGVIVFGILAACGTNEVDQVEKQQYQAQVENKLQELEDKIADVKANLDRETAALSDTSADTLASDMEAEVDQQITKLERMTDDLEKKIAEIDNVGSERWTVLKTEIDSALENLQTEFERVQQTAFKY